MWLRLEFAYERMGPFGGTADIADGDRFAYSITLY